MRQHSPPFPSAWCQPVWPATSHIAIPPISIIPIPLDATRLSAARQQARAVSTQVGPSPGGTYVAGCARWWHWSGRRFCLLPRPAAAACRCAAAAAALPGAVRPQLARALLVPGKTWPRAGGLMKRRGGGGCSSSCLLPFIYIVLVRALYEQMSSWRPVWHDVVTVLLWHHVRHPSMPVLLDVCLWPVCGLSGPTRDWLLCSLVMCKWTRPET